jgi:hypothetical protein
MEARGVVDLSLTSDAAEFVRYCYGLRRAGWPELYDEMCQVAARRAFRGWDAAELSVHGIGFSLFQTPALAQLVRRVLEADGAPAPRPGLPAPRPSAREFHDDLSAVQRRRTLVKALGAA